MNIVPSDSPRVRITKKGDGYPGFRMKNYGIMNRNISTAEIMISIRYPETGFAVNTECDMSAYVRCGSGWVFVGKSRKGFSPGDVIVIKKGEKYRFEPDQITGRSYDSSPGFGKMITLIASYSPAWKSRQHQIVE